MSDQLREAIRKEGGLLNAGDVMRLWGVTTGGVTHIMRQPDAPQPIGRVSGGKWPVWSRADVLAYRPEKS